MIFSVSGPLSTTSRRSITQKKTIWVGRFFCFLTLTFYFSFLLCIIVFMFPKCFCILHLSSLLPRLAFSASVSFGAPRPPLRLPSTHCASGAPLVARACERTGAPRRRSVSRPCGVLPKIPEVNPIMKALPK